VSDDDFTDLRQLLVRAQEPPEPNRHEPAVTRGRRRRRVIGAIVAVALIGAAVGTYLPLVLLAPVDSATGTVRTPVVDVPAAVSLAIPQGAASAVSVTGAEEFPATLGTDGILAATGEVGPQPIASISKLITALVVLQAKPLAAGEAGPTITFGKADSDLYDKYYLLGATIQAMKTGSTMSQHDALELMLVASASNYAEAVSNWAFGSQDRFRSATRSWLAANGLAATTIVEPTGIDARNTSTPANLLTLARLAVANPVVAEIVGMKNLDVPGFAPESNTNSVLGQSGITGLKTGNLEETGASLLFSATVDVTGLDAPLSIVGVILGGESRYTVGIGAVELIESIRAGFHVVQLTRAGDQLGIYETAWDSAGYVELAETASVLTWSDTPVTVELESNPVRIGASDAAAGSVTFVAGARTVTVPLVVPGSIEGPGGWWRVMHPVELLGD
jgi:D-alanyl-D-alanine carboxypeptidase (penicillin-binding protein 5/6)